MGGNIKKYQKPAKVSSLTHTSSSPAIVFLASFWAFFFAKNSSSSLPDKLSEGCPEVITGGADGGNRPSFWSIYRATSKISSSSATGSRTNLVRPCFQRQPPPAPGLAPPRPHLLFPLLFFMLKSHSVTSSKNGCTLLFISLLLLFFTFFSCVYTGCYSDPVACGAPEFWVSRPGGRAINPAPPPAHVFISRFLLCLLCLLCLDCCYLQERERRKFPALPPR